MWYPHHPAPGFGDLIPGFFVLPQNPVVDIKDRRLMPYGFAGKSFGCVSQVGYVPRIGDLMRSRMAVPSNPLIRSLRAGMSGGMSGCCCSGDGEGSQGAAPDDTNTGYVNGAPVLSSGFVEGIDWTSLALGAGAVALVMNMRKR